MIMAIRWSAASRALWWIGGGGVGVAAVALTLGLGLGVLWSMRSPVRGSEAAQAADVDKGKRPLPDRVDDLEAFAPPVGTVMAYAGPWPPRRPGDRAATEDSVGWLLCDGRTFAQLIQEHRISQEQLEGLKVALGGERLPDLRGVFLRGVDASIDGKSTSGRDKEGIRQVGKDQLPSTAMPIAAFRTEAAGAHNHNHDLGPGANFDRILNFGRGPWTSTGFDGKMVAGTEEPYVNDSKPLVPAKDHTHVIEGGDAETRPYNVGVYWIIKFR
jgi:hypothetical protein